MVKIMGVNMKNGIKYCNKRHKNEGCIKYF